MAKEITIPRLGWSMEEGTFTEWLKRPGDRVEAGEPLFSVESDKVTMEVESLDNGTLFIPADAPGPGAVVTVGQLLGYLLINGETAPAPKPAAVTPALASVGTAPAPQPVETGAAHFVLDDSNTANLQVGPDSLSYQLPPGASLPA